MTYLNQNMVPMFDECRDPQAIFEAAILRGILSADETAPNFAGNYTYMGDSANGGALFKDKMTRAYLPACALSI